MVLPSLFPVNPFPIREFTLTFIHWTQIVVSTFAFWTFALIPTMLRFFVADFKELKKRKGHEHGWGHLHHLHLRQLHSKERPRSCSPSSSSDFDSDTDVESRSTLSLPSSLPLSAKSTGYPCAHEQTHVIRSTSPSSSESDSASISVRMSGKNSGSRSIRGHGHGHANGQGHISSVFGNVKKLPRKASRLVCMVNPSEFGEREHASIEQVAFPAPTRSGSSDSGTLSDASLSTDGSSKGRWRTHTSSKSEPQRDASSGGEDRNCIQRAHSGDHPISPSPLKPTPIMSPDQLEAALRQTSISFDAPSIPQVPEPRRPKPRAADGLAVQVHTERKYVISTIDDSQLNVELIAPSTTPTEPIHRPLSPPPNHFRRRVLSTNGPSSSPYTSPVHSPPVSPRATFFGTCEEEEENGSIALHEVLSTESLVAPRKLTLYKPELDEANSKETVSLYDACEKEGRHPRGGLSR